MTRRFSALILLLIPAIITSCWKTDEDWSLCAADENLLLRFRVQGVADADFDEYIDAVDVFLFDAGHNFLEARRVSETAADGSHTTTFSVVPGTYHVVAWGNITANSRHSVMGAASNFENSFIEIASSETGCPIYYAPYKTPGIHPDFAASTRADEPDYSSYSVEVLPATQTVKELVFAKAHRKVEVFLTGYENTDLWDGKSPGVEKIGAGGKYDFLLRAHLTPVTLNRRTVRETVDSRAMFTTAFHSALIPLRSDMEVNIYHPTTGEELATVNLEEYVAENNITDDSYIPILFSFDLDANVSVSMPSWNENPIGW